MKIKLLLLLFLLGSLAFAQEPVPHPRLLMRAGEEVQIPPESMFARADSVIVAFSDAVLDEPTVTRTMVGRRLLHTSREALKRIFWLGYTFRVHGGEAYAQKALDEVLAVSAFSDWNPSHFLDVAEMTMAVAIGYDWLYDRMTPEERKTVARAIIDKGLKPALNEADAWFYRSEINWNSVCNAGMVYGALAVWEEDPDFCQSMLEKSLESSPLAFKAYDVIPSEAKESVTDDFLASADFIRFTSTPAGNCFSFSDSERKAFGQYMQAWMMNIDDPSLLYPEMRIMEETGYRRLCEERLFPMLLIALAGGPEFEIRPPEGHYFQCNGTTPIYVYRSGWTSRDDDYLGVKGGFAMSSHSHIDQGSFYFESDGVTWATDLGMQDYESLESAGVDLWDMLQDSERWSVFRIGPFSHNILTVNGEVPKVNRAVPFRRTLKPERPSKSTPVGAELSLGHMYDDVLDQYVRKVLFDGDDLVIEDRLQAKDSACTVRWAMCSEANATLYDGHIVLYTDGKHRLLSVSTDGSVSDLTPHIWPTTYDPATPDVDGMQYLHETDAPNPGTSLVGYTFTLQPHQKVALHVCLARVL